jgi:hypothetical protein
MPDGEVTIGGVTLTADDNLYTEPGKAQDEAAVTDAHPVASTRLAMPRPE